MRKIGMLAGFAATLLFATSCSTPCPEPPVVEVLDMDAVRTEIAAMEAEYERASNANEYEAVAAYYSEDAKSYPPNKPMRDGKAAIIAAMTANPDNGNTVKLTVEELWAEGNIAVERGTYEDMNAEGATVDKGRYISVFEKRDGKYICIRDIWNSEMPATPAAPVVE